MICQLVGEDMRLWMKLLDVNAAWTRPPATWDLLRGCQTLNTETRWRLRDIGAELSWGELDKSQALLNHTLSRYLFYLLFVGSQSAFCPEALRLCCTVYKHQMYNVHTILKLYAWNFFLNVTLNYGWPFNKAFLNLRNIGLLSLSYAYPFSKCLL